MADPTTARIQAPKASALYSGNVESQHGVIPAKGRGHSLRLWSRALTWAWGAILLGLWGAGGCVSGVEQEKQNVLLITLDTTRADHLATYGYFRETTPHLDALARESVVFEQFLVPMATTLPTHMSIFTGVWPLEHGVLANIKHGGLVVEPSEQLHSVVEVFRDAGYRTAGFVSAAPLKQGTGVEHGFKNYDEPEAPSRIAFRTVDKARGWLRRWSSHKVRPFFLWVHVFDPHAPLTPPPPFDTTYAPEPSLERFLGEREATASVRVSGEPLDPVRAANLYDGELAYMDACLGPLLQDVLSADWGKDTVIVVAGDHGEGLGGHGVAGHGGVWGEQIHAPFWIRAPRLAAGRRAYPVTAVDVMPTLVSLLQIPGGERFLDQASGYDVLAGAPNRPLLHLPVGRAPTDADPAARALTVGHIRYRESARDGSLYDLRDDRHELMDEAPYWPLTTHYMRQWLHESAEQQEVRGAQLGRVTPKPADRATIEQLEALGYVN